MAQTNTIQSKQEQPTNDAVTTTVPVKDRYKFEKNHRYMTISLYVLAVVVISTLFISLVMNISVIGEKISSFISVMLPFIAAFFIAYFLNPLVKAIDKHFLKKLLRIKRRKLRKFLSILLSYIFFIGFVALILTFIIPQFADSLNDLIGKIPALYDIAYEWLEKIEDKLPYFDWGIVEDQLKSSMPQIIQVSTEFVTNIFPKIIDLGFSIVSLFINIILSVVISCYMISDKHILADNATRVVYAILPKKYAVSFCNTVKECNAIFSGFVIGKAIDSLIIGCICFMLMSILGLSYSVLISVIVGITNMIPYFGPFIGAVPGIFILLLTEPLQALIFAVLIFLLQQFDGLYLGPTILGQSVGVKPLWIIFGITVGGAYGGVFGMFIGVPLVAVIAHLLNKAVNAGLRRHEVTEEELPKKSSKA